jgi:Uma2 family endonuclease
MSTALVPLQEALGGQIRPLHRDDYDRLVDAGVFEGEPIELLEGFLVQMSPEGPPHVFVIDRLTELLVSALAGRYLVRISHPLALGERSEPEPDVAVAHRGDYRRAHPRTALLVIESASSSRRRDLGFKADLYARHGIPEYWVVDVDAGQVVVHTQPRPNGYARVTRHGSGSRLTPTTIDQLTLAVDDFLP